MLGCNTHQTSPPRDVGLQHSSNKSHHGWHGGGFITLPSSSQVILQVVLTDGSPGCVHCPDILDDAEHTFFRYPPEDHLFTWHTLNGQGVLEDDGGPGSGLDQMITWLQMENPKGLTGVPDYRLATCVHKEFLPPLPKKR
ncbi:hypothetical protein J6590_086282 [Homalodisca vitripennis]|nr:hypothetical protein J6590_086282 [Homalodisca vitripennis]